MVTQKITIEPVTRIEGHAKVTVHMKDDGTVEHAYFHVNEFRGFEKFCEGRFVSEMQQITPVSAVSARSAITWLLPKPPISSWAVLLPVQHLS